MADMPYWRKCMLLTTALSGVVPVMVYMMMGLWKEISEEQQDWKDALESLYRYMGMVLFFQSIIRSFGRYLLMAGEPDGQNRPRFNWSAFVWALMTFAFLTFANFWGLEVLRKFQLAKYQDEFKTCENLTRIAYSSGLYCYDSFPKNLTYYDVIEEVMITFQSCSK